MSSINNEISLQENLIQLTDQDQQSKLISGLNQQTEQATLARQAQTFIDKNIGDAEKIEGKVSYLKMISYGSITGKCYFVIACICALGAGASMPISLTYIGKLFDNGNISLNYTTMKEAAEDFKDDQIYQIKVMIIIGGIGWVLAWIYVTLLTIFAEEVTINVRRTYLSKILGQDNEWYDQIIPGEFSSQIALQTENIKKAIKKTGKWMADISMGITGIILGFYYGWELSLYIFAYCPVIVITGALFASVQSETYKESMKAYGQSAGYSAQALTAFKVVVSFGQQQLELKNYNTFLGRSAEVGRKGASKYGFSLAMMMLSVNILFGFVFMLGSYFYYIKRENPSTREAYTGGELFNIIVCLLFGFQQLGQIPPTQKAIQEGQTSAKSIFDIIDRKPRVVQDDPNAIDHTLVGQIELKNVDFYYPTRPDKKILNNLSCTFESGKTTALVGPSGSGKSTIVQLIERFYDSSQGEVLIDGVDIKTINLRKYRQQVGYVGQEPVMFNTTLRENIMLGVHGATDEEINIALKEAKAYDFVQKLPANIDNELGQGGNAVSGGQKQRLAIARAFLKKPQILILDEATSALDTKNEQLVQQAFDQKQKNSHMTTIVIAHRLDTIKNADKILVVKDGQIVEEGNHDQLLYDHQDGIYAGLIKQHEQNKHQENKLHDEEEDVDAIPIPELDKKKSSSKKSKKVRRQSLTKESYRGSVLQGDEMEKHEDADIKDQEQQAPNNKILENFKEKNVNSELKTYAKPLFDIILVFIGSFLCGGAAPIIYIPFIKITLLFNDTAMTSQHRWEEQRNWSLFMFGIGILLAIGYFIQKRSLGIIGENITLGIRSNLYKNLISRDQGFHDEQQHSSGLLGTILSKDCLTIKSAGVETLGVYVQSSMALLVGVGVSLYYNWKICLVGLAGIPFIFFGNYIQMKLMEEDTEGEENEKENTNAEIITYDAISNYRTIASFGHDYKVVDLYYQNLIGPKTKQVKMATLGGFFLGYSTFVTPAFMAFCFYMISIFGISWAGDKPFNIPNAVEYGDYLTAMMLSAFMLVGAGAEAGAASALGGDLAAGAKAGFTVFRLIKTKSKIDPIDIPQGSKEINMQTFRGDIQFKDVWFRYPTRTTQWVFKNMNLKIPAGKSCAVVGESGCGKSTFISLVLRFYDINFGNIYIDGVDIKEYNIQSLRKAMGFVMQEPILFNYSILENILYGDLNAANSQVREAVRIANAEFVENSSINMGYDDTASSLLDGYKKEEQALITILGKQKYDKQLKQLTAKDIEEEESGKFQPQEKNVDNRDKQCHDIELSSGYSINCGVRGGKLSGGQKQRIAIARAVIRQPKILILDEATSALDEKSQFEVQKAIDSIMVNKTALVIAHRITTIQKCDMLAVIKDGQVKELGTFNDLYNKENGIFAEIAKGLSSN